MCARKSDSAKGGQINVQGFVWLYGSSRAGLQIPSFVARI